jgi:hypothetical protein
MMVMVMMMVVVVMVVVVMIMIMLLIIRRIARCIVPKRSVRRMTQHRDHTTSDGTDAERPACLPP